MGENDIIKAVPDQQTDLVQTEPVGKEQIRKWQQIFDKYKSGKKRLEQRVIDAEQAWKLRHWEQIRNKDIGDPEPASGWLVNVIFAKHSDACDNYPQPICLPREQGDEQEAKSLSSILPVILQQNQFKKVWSDVWWYKLKGGTGVYGVFWDTDKNGGLGDISIKKIDILNLFWEPGVTDIQDSRYVFYADLIDNETLEEQYPQLKDKLTHGKTTLSQYVYEDSIDTSCKSMVVDVYYKKRVGGQDVLHFAKYVNEELLFATENDVAGETELTQDPATGQPVENVVRKPMAETGIYAHGKYPFVFDALFPEEGYPNCGFGYVDLCKDPQKFIDVMDNALIKNMLANATPRWFIRQDGGVNEQEYADVTKPFIHISGRLNSESIMPVTPTSLNTAYIDLKQLKIDELKQISGNRDVNNGGTGASVTAASAIAALQEAGNGISRDMISASYRAFSQVIELCIELIREFYDVPRKFRILGENGSQEYISFDNSGMKPQAQGMEYGLDMGYRLPVFDIEVEVQKESTYTTAAYNELAVQLYQLGVFNPQLADQTLMMLDMMDFKGKDKIRQKVQENATLEKYKMLALQLAMKYDPMLAQQMMADMGMGGAMAGGMGDEPMPSGHVNAKDIQNNGGENPYVAKARQAAEGGSEPR